MAKTKSAQPSKKPSRGSASASPITPPAPPAPATEASGSSSAPAKSARKSKTQARKSVVDLASPPVVASPIASSTPGFGDHDESHSSDHTLSKSSSSSGALNVDKALVTLPTVSSRTRSKVSTPKNPEVVKPKIASKGKKVVTSSSKVKNLKENPPSV
ncbi:endochitinase A-like [Cannabis sativa]|uniref:endochitinase A-like n=1 Tax=Cannabis sativa TaxID=3483 RepID=UPI0029C9C3F8|nr:endochitinase A-like [Cannabis sativa]